jgi:hypothetical protein
MDCLDGTHLVCVCGGGMGYSSILLNGKPDAYFECKKGVRQGDPLSSYLFF